MRVGIVGKTDNSEVCKLTDVIIKKFSSFDVEVILEAKLAELVSYSHSYKIDNIHKHVDLVVVLGGDGTFLGVARMVSKHGIPIVGINMGSLGFLSEVTKDEAIELIEIIVKKNYEIEKRDMISAAIIRDGKQIEKYDVLNDVVINRSANSRIMDMSVDIDGFQCTKIKSDGLILSTPTGSTAYSLSAGGPIVYPILPLIIITPICPHTLTNRPLVVSNNRTIRVKVLPGSSEKYLSLDGQIAVKLKTDDIIEVIKSNKSVNLIKSPFRDFFSILKTKLMWGERYDTI